ncbi:CHRD domain-containing protein [Flavobacterium sp. ZS1P14]|uniref:CHRD domain-containing protein n=1 Tax=Flavobacterium sp. ZS1P14 TaxID=3401729 RepID=UPI003AB02E35
MKRIFRFFAITFFLLGIASCGGDGYNSPGPNPNPTTVTYKATLNGSNEFPAVTSSAMGNATLTFNNTTKAFTINVTHNVVNPTMAHIHRGLAGSSPANNIVFELTSTSATTYTLSGTLNAAQEADLKAVPELYYVNIHSTAHSTGEIRGQLVEYVAPY